MLNNDQKSVCAGLYDFTLKLTFDPSDLKCDHFILLYILLPCDFLSNDHSDLDL